MKKLLLLFSLSLLVPVLVVSSCAKNEDSPATTVKVTYDANGGKFTSHGSVPTIDTIVKIGDYVPYPSDPTRPNYVFKGWCEDRECKILWSWLTKVEKDITLYAKWEDDGGGGGGGGGKKTLKVEADTVSVTETTATIWGSVTIAAGTEIDDYGVKYYVEPFVDTVMISVKETSDPAMFSCSVENLFPDTTYRYFAYAVDAKGNEVKSTEKSFRTKPGPVYPEAPTLKSVYVNGTWWAPVNCGYDATDYKYGELYQWGRKYGQYYESGQITPTVMTKEEGESAANKDKFGQCSDPLYNWFTGDVDNTLWNEDSKGTYDPCPTGWRVPTVDELGNMFFSDYDPSDPEEAETLRGTWNSTRNGYDVAGLFIPAAGYRNYAHGSAGNRDSRGIYWSSSHPVTEDTHTSYCLAFEEEMQMIYHSFRADGYSVRCVQQAIAKGNGVIDGSMSQGEIEEW